MLMIRLQRVGRKHDPSFRVVLTDKRNGPQSGKFLEVLGNYNARFGTPSLKGERIKYWMGKGAQVSDTLHNLLISEKVIEGKKINVLPKKSPIVKEVAEEEKKEATTPEETPTEEKKEDTSVEKEAPAEEKPAEEVPPIEEKEEKIEEAKEEVKAKATEGSSPDASEEASREEVKKESDAEVKPEEDSSEEKKDAATKEEAEK